MSAQTTDFDQLALRILQDRTGQLTAPELDALLTWLAGGERRGASVLTERLGGAGGQPRLLRQVYEDLDDALFSPDGLELEAAFVSDRESETVRKARYRRLMNAFHPDRFVDHAEWLTPRSQSIHAAYQAYRRSESTPSPVATTHPAPETGSYRPRNPRGSARLTPAEPGPLRRLRWRLRNVENLQAKILLGLAALTLAPLLLIYLVDTKPSSTTSTAPLPETTSPAVAAAPLAALTVPKSQSEPDPEPSSSGNEPQSPQQELRAASSDLAQSERPQAVEAITEPDDPNPALEQALAARLELSESRFEPPQGLRPMRLPQSERRQPPESARPAQRQRQPQPVPVTPEPEPSPAQQPTQEPPQEPPQETPQTPAQERPRSPEPEPQELEIEPVNPASQPESSRPAISVSAPEPEPVPELAPAPEVPPEQSTEQRVAAVLAAYKTAFTEGDLEAFMATLSANPRENRNRGRDWFLDSYRRLFRESSSRRLDVTIARIEPLPDGWQVTALFELWVAYPNRRPTHAEQLVRYTLEPDGTGQLRIAAIDY